VDARHALACSREAWPLWVPVLFLVGYVATTGAIAMGDRSRHPFTLNITNLYVMLIIGWLCFLPMILAQARIAWALLHKPPVVLLAFLGLGLYFATYSNPHEYNQAQFRWFLHNELLYWMDSSRAFRAAMFFPALSMALWIAINVRDARSRVLTVFSAISIGVHPLIEQRYYLPFFVLLNLWRPQTSPREEGLLIAYEVPVAIALFCGMALLAFFL
jgi:hypothetical protein